MSVTIKQEPHYDLPTATAATTDTLVQVKQEDTKDFKIVIDQLQDVVDELAERPDIEIKLEAATKVEDGLQSARSNQDIYYYCCNLCGKKMLDLRSTILHKQEVHNTNYRTTRFKNLDLEPDVDDPSNFCATCDKTFSTKDAFEIHLKTLHFIARVKSQVLEPDVNDRNFYCQSCDFQYIDKKFYFRHLKSYHGIKISASAVASASASSSAAALKIPKIIKKKQRRSKIYCRACGDSFSSKKNYHYHTNFVHGISRKTKVDANMVILPIYQEQYQCRACNGKLGSKQLYLEHLHMVHAMNITEDAKAPDVNDPNFYCCMCDASSSSYDSFQTHLLAVHNICASFSSASSSSLKLEDDNSLPDPHDPSFYCRTCRQNFFFKDNYKKHLLLVHQIGHTSSSSVSSFSSSLSFLSPSLPDINDPNYYCSVCQKGLKTAHQYRQHCRVTHKMELNNQRLPIQHAIIDPNDPNSHCAQCNRTYANYRQHLRYVHNMIVPVSAAAPPPQ